MTNSPIRIIKVKSDSELNLAQQIRYQVFVIGQNVPAEEEIDQFENDCNHFLALYHNKPCGAARWRITSSGVKLERFAVLETFRNKGIGSALVKAVLDDISSKPDTLGKQLYLHSQISAMPLYQKFGFAKEGEIFQECEIDHYTMKKPAQ